MSSLVEDAMQGDKEAFAELIRTKKNTLYRTGRCYLSNDEDIADAAQNTILICYEKLNTLKHPEFFSTWMTRIMINECKRIGKSQSHHEKIEDYHRDISREIQNVDSRLCFEDMMNSLPPQYRTALSLYYGENFSIKEIANILGLSESAVKKRLSRGREILKNGYFKNIGE